LFSSGLLADYTSVATAQTVLVEESFQNATASPTWEGGIGSADSAGVGSDLPCLTAAPPSATNPPTGVVVPNFPVITPLEGCPPNPNNPGAPIDQPGSGVLRITSSRNNQAGFIFNNQPIPSSNGLIITFDTYQYGGTGADGISFFLIDGTQAPPTRAGAFGGSLGYAQRTGVPGLVNGYIGIGFDAFGNYSNGDEGRNGGVPGANLGNRIPDAISIRGSESSNYLYLTGTPTLPFSLDSPQTTRSDAILRKVRIVLTPNNRVSVELDNGAGFVTIIPSFDLTSVPGQGPLPSQLLFGFAASTGDQTNINEIRSFQITTVPPNLSLAKTAVTNPFTVGQTAVYNLQVQNAPNAGSTGGAITVTDTLPAGLSFVSATGTDWLCTASGALVTCTYNGGNVPPGGVLPSIALTVRVEGNAPASITNTAQVTTPLESDPNDNTATVVTPISAAPILIAEKTAALTDANGNGVANPGEVLTYTIAFRNQGNAPATNTRFTDAIPANTTYVPSSTTLNGVAVPDINGAMPYANGGLVNSPSQPAGQIPVNATATVQFSVRINESIPGGTNQIINQGTVQSTEITTPIGTDDPNQPGPNDPTLTDLGTGRGNLRLVKRVTAITRSGIPVTFNTFVDDPNDANDNAAGWAALPPIGTPTLDAANALQGGDEIEYTIYFLSDGTAPAIGVSLCDQLSGGIRVIPSSSVVQLGASSSPLPGGQLFSPLAPLPDGTGCANAVNPDGAIVFDVGDITNVPTNNVGFVRFRARVE
jgi:uncharacterized repeat protein (TIGR01451 family)